MGADLADMQLITKCNTGFRFLLCAINIYSKYPLILPLKEKKQFTISNAFQKTLDESNRKPNKLLIDKDIKIYNRSRK